MQLGYVFRWAYWLGGCIFFYPFARNTDEILKYTPLYWCRRVNWDVCFTLHTSTRVGIGGAGVHEILPNGVWSKLEWSKLDSGRLSVCWSVCVYFRPEFNCCQVIHVSANITLFPDSSWLVRGKGVGKGGEREEEEEEEGNCGREGSLWRSGRERGAWRKERRVEGSLWRGGSGGKFVK